MGIFSQTQTNFLNQNVSLKKRFQYFECCVNPAMLFGLITFPMTRTMLKSMDALQRKMMRRIIGWRRLDTESWELQCRE